MTDAEARAELERRGWKPFPAYVAGPPYYWLPPWKKTPADHNLVSEEFAFNYLESAGRRLGR